MKVFYTVLKVIAALAVVAGIVYVVATYGDKIVAWAKGLIHNCKKRCCFASAGGDISMAADELDFEG